MGYSSTIWNPPPFKYCLAMSYVIFLSIHLIYLSIQVDELNKKYEKYEKTQAEAEVAEKEKEKQKAPRLFKNASKEAEKPHDVKKSVF